MRNMNRFENIDYFAKAFGIQAVGVSTPVERDDMNISDAKPRDENEIDPFSTPGMPGMSEPTPEGEDTAVRDWLLRRYMTLHTKEVNEKLRNNEEVVIEDPFAKPEKDVSDPFYPGGLEGNPNTAPPENPEIVYDPDPEAEDRAAEESQNPDMGDPSGEHSANYMCYVPNTDTLTGNHSDTGMPFTQEQCAEAGAEWREIPMDINPGDGGSDPWGDPGTPEGDP